MEEKRQDAIFGLKILSVLNAGENELYNFLVSLDSEENGYSIVQFPPYFILRRTDNEKTFLVKLAGNELHFVANLPLPVLLEVRGFKFEFKSKHSLTPDDIKNFHGFIDDPKTPAASVCAG